MIRGMRPCQLVWLCGVAAIMAAFGGVLALVPNRGGGRNLAQEVASSCRAGARFLRSDSSWSRLQSTVAEETSSPTDERAEELASQKQKLLGLLRLNPTQDPVLADPITKENVTIYTKTILLGGGDRFGSRHQQQRAKYQLKSSQRTYQGSADSFFNLLEPVDLLDDTSNTTDRDQVARTVWRNVLPFIPPPVRSALATAGLPMGQDYVPMRDLFTSPAVSYAYERGWRQGFAAAGFPGPDKEAQMAMEYFEPAMAQSGDRVLVDMSCATGLFTRRFAASGKYTRVLGCDYSASMLEEARRRIQADRSLMMKNQKTRLDLVRCDVGQIPMKDASVQALHAGAAMHCWPDLPAAVSEIYRVLKPGGRYFATTFLSTYFGNLQAAEGGATGPSRQAFQYFESKDMLRSLLENGGFAPDKISIEILGNACVVIHCEKS